MHPSKTDSWATASSVQYVKKRKKKKVLRYEVYVQNPVWVRSDWFPIISLSEHQ